MCAVAWATSPFRCYLYGKKFVLRTDHAALTYLHKFADNNCRPLRWSLKQAEYDFTVEHRPGTQIRHADALSRVVQTVTGDQPLTRHDIKAGQAVDKFCLSLEVGRPKGSTEYFVDEDGIIFEDARTANISW
jgi:hypothetical protein